MTAVQIALHTKARRILLGGISALGSGTPSSRIEANSCLDESEFELFASTAASIANTTDAIIPPVSRYAPHSGGEMTGKTTPATADAANSQSDRLGFGFD